VAPTAAAAASHQPLARARLTAGLQQRNLLVRHPGHRPARGGPLQRREDHVEKDDPGRRRVWFNCACCPPNIMRLIASLEHYLATESGDTLYIQQYTGSRLSGAGLDLEVTTDYPWSGAVYLRVLTAPQAGRGLALRVPAWSANTRILVNNDPERTVVSPGYHILHRRWQPGDVITVHLDVTPCCPASGRHIYRLVRSSSLFCLRGNCYRDPVFAVGQPRRRADARLDAPGLC